MITSGALRRAKRGQRSIMLRKFGHLPIPEILVMACPLRPARTPSRPTVLPHHRHTNVNNSINRYGNPNANRGYFGGKSHSHPCLVKQRQLKSQSERKRKAEIGSLSVSSCQQTWNIELEKDREKEKVGSRPAKLNEKKGNRDLEREIKNKGDSFFCWKNNMKIL